MSLLRSFIGYAGDSWNNLKEVFVDYEENSDLFLVGLIKKSSRVIKFSIGSVIVLFFQFSIRW